MKRVIIGLAALLLTLGTAPAARAQTWNLANDFSTTTNGGTNPWAYGFYSSGLTPSSFTAFSTYQLRDAGTLATWFGGSASVDPNIQKNLTATAYTQPGSTITFAPGEVTFGPFRGPTVARWTALSSGLFDISAAFQTVQTVNGAPNAYVFVNGTQADPFPTAVTPAGISWTSAGPLSLMAGQSVDFVVWGNNQNNKTTQVQASIASVPEPGALALLTSGLLALGAAARRRRRA